MKKMFVVTLAVCLYQINASAQSATPMNVPAECKNLALMQAQLMNTRFQNNAMGGGTYNPSQLTLKTSNGLKIGKIEYLGGDSEEQSGPNAGKYPCDLDRSLCSTPADAGGAIDWARVNVTSGGATPYDVAEVVVSMGSRGGCLINSAKINPQ